MSFAIKDQAIDPSAATEGTPQDKIDHQQTWNGQNTHHYCYQSQNQNDKDLISEAFKRSFDLWAKSIYELSKCGAALRLAEISIPPLWKSEQDLFIIQECRTILIDAWSYLFRHCPLKESDFSFEQNIEATRLSIRSKSGLSDISFSQESFRAMCAALLKIKSLTHLEIGAKFLGDREILILSELIHYSEHLQEIYVMGSYRDEGGELLTKALEATTSPFHTLWIQGQYNEEIEKKFTSLIKNKSFPPVLSYWIYSSD